MSWMKNGFTVTAKYLDTFDIVGVVQSSRVKYGGTVQHTVKLNTPITVYGSERTTVLLDENEITIIA